MALSRVTDPRWITEDALFAIHAAQIERSGGAHGVIDANVVRSALARAINRFSYDAGCDMADPASMYLVAFAGSQGFRDGNKRTGVACALVFLAINGITLERIEPDLLELVAFKVSRNEAGAEDVANFFRSQLADS